jgi:hypothetical protein
VNKDSILGLFTISIAYLLAAMTLTQYEVKALEFDFGGDNGFHFDLGNFPGGGEQGPIGPQGSQGDKGNTRIWELLRNCYT